MRPTPSTPLHDEVWESLGASDPDWAVLTDPSRRHGGWSTDLEAFYASGRAEVNGVIAGLSPDAGRERALDWGSGTGRLTFALLDAYAQVTAVDVSSSMLTTLGDRAQRLGLADRVTSRLVRDLRPASDHDLALSLLVLQHLPNQDAVLEAVRAIVASVRLGGHVVLEIPDRPTTVKARLQPRFVAYRVLRAVLRISPQVLHRHGLSGISMRCVPQQLVRAALSRAGADLVRLDEHSDGAHHYVRYVARRNR